jgi:hypothetical protein
VTDHARPDAALELFLFDGHGHHGALLIAAPSGLEHHDSVARDWVAAHVIAEIDAKARMRDQIRIATRQWQDRARPDALLWRGAPPSTRGEFEAAMQFLHVMATQTKLAVERIDIQLAILSGVLREAGTVADEADD